MLSAVETLNLNISHNLYLKIYCVKEIFLVLKISLENNSVIFTSFCLNYALGILFKFVFSFGLGWESYHLFFFFCLSMLKVLIYFSSSTTLSIP